jgi:predicted Zn-dependent protease
MVFAVCFLLHLTGCAVNPVTGERNFSIYGSAWEQQVGSQMYAPMKQSQGGDYVLDQELTAYLGEVGHRLAAQARRKDQLQFEFSIINSSVPNAWALPGGKIVVNRGLLTELDSEAELAAVLAHEIVHADAAHGARQQSAGMLAQIGAVASMVVLSSKVASAAGRQVAMMVPTVGAQLIMQKYGRDAERESDEYGMLYMADGGYDPLGAVRLQETFVKLSEGRNEDWLSGLFASHPPSRERVENNRKTAAGLPAGGVTERQRYHDRTAYLRRVQPAYAAYDEAMKAVSDNQLELAQSKLDLAMGIEPREALFLALQGDIHVLRKNPERALSAYNRAIQANDGYFYAYLRQGQVEFDRKRWQSARSSLEKSLSLLPTADAHYLLGVLDRDNGKPETAIEHFNKASAANSMAGKNARKELILLDLGKNPSRYISTQAVLDKSNKVWVQISNGTDLPMKNIEINVIWLDEQGVTQQARQMYAGPLAGGEADQLPLDLKFGDAGELSKRVKVQVLAAQIAQ